MAGKGAKRRNDAKRIRHGKRGKNRPQVTRTIPPTPVKEIRLKTLPEAMDTFEKIIGLFNAGKMKREKFTALVYGLNSYANLLRMAREEDFLRRLERLEEVLKERGLYDSKSA